MVSFKKLDACAKFGPLRCFTDRCVIHRISSPLRRRASEITVEFVDEKLISQCMSCNTMFTAVVRKHHCVACGKVYCGKCSKVRAHSEHGVLLRQRFCVLCEEQCASRSIISKGNQLLLSKQRASPPRMQTAAPPVMALAGSKTIQRRKSGSCSCSIHIQQPISATAVLCTIKPKRKAKRERPVMAEVHPDPDAAESYSYEYSSTGGEESSRSVSPAQRSGCSTSPMPTPTALALALQVNDSMVSQDEASGLDSSTLDACQDGGSPVTATEPSLLGDTRGAGDDGEADAGTTEVARHFTSLSAELEKTAQVETGMWTRAGAGVLLLAAAGLTWWMLVALGVLSYGHNSTGSCSGLTTRGLSAHPGSLYGVSGARDGEGLLPAVRALLTSQYVRFLQQQAQHRGGVAGSLDPAHGGHGDQRLAAYQKSVDVRGSWTWWGTPTAVQSAGEANAYAPPSSAEQVARGVYTPEYLLHFSSGEMHTSVAAQRRAGQSIRNAGRQLGWSLSAVGDELRRVFNDAPLRLEGDRIASVELSEMEGSDRSEENDGNTPSVAINIVFVMERKPLLSRAGDFFGNVRKALLYPLREIAENVDDVLL